MIEFLHLCCATLVVFLVPAAILNGWFLWRVLMPIRKLSTQMDGIAAGDFDRITQQVGGIAEIRSLHRILQGMVGHIRRDQQHRQRYMQAMSDGQEAERSRLAHDLHDDTVQSLIAIGQSIDLARQFSTTQGAQSEKMLTLARQQITETAHNLRNIIGNLRPPALEELGLIPALQTWADQLTGIRLEIRVEGTARRLESGQELALFRCAQEAITNAQKHAGAEVVQIIIVYHPDTIHLTVNDNGRGFSVPASMTDFACHGHYGLLGIQERVERLDGQFTLHSTPTEGTHLSIILPLSQPPQPADTVRDPVCSALIHPHEAYGSLRYVGQQYYFCCAVCQGAFQNHPEMYGVMRERGSLPTAPRLQELFEGNQ